MKKSPQQVASSFVTPPGETMRDTVVERRFAAHRNDPTLHWQHPIGEHDRRPEVAAQGALEKFRARQMELRTAEQCHVRTRRRSPLEQ